MAFRERRQIRESRRWTGMRYTAHTHAPPAQNLFQKRCDLLLDVLTIFFFEIRDEGTNTDFFACRQETWLLFLIQTTSS